MVLSPGSRTLVVAIALFSTSCASFTANASSRLKRMASGQWDVIDDGKQHAISVFQIRSADENTIEFRSNLLPFDRCNPHVGLIHDLRIEILDFQGLTITFGPSGTALLKWPNGEEVAQFRKVGPYRTWVCE